jgi:hypothetical protein
MRVNVTVKAAFGQGNNTKGSETMRGIPHGKADGGSKALPAAGRACWLLILLGAILALQAPQDAQAEFSLGPRTLMLSDEAATREYAGDEWEGSHFSAIFRVKKSWLIEVGFASFNDVEDEDPISVSPGKGNIWVIPPDSELSGTSYYAQFGYRFYLIDKAVSWTAFGLWADASVGYEGISASRDITNSDAYDYLSEDVDLDIGFYIQPRINLVFEPGKKGWYGGFQIAYEQYFSSDVENGLSGGFVVGYSKKK